MELKTAASRILNQLAELVETLSDSEYTSSLTVLNKYTLGQHVRHTLEFFTCLKAGLKSGVVNYDKRDHDKAIENDRFVTLSKIGEIKTFIESASNDKSLILELSYGETQENPTSIDTNFARELAYNIEHGVHHMAIIKIGALSLRSNLKLPADFGVAVSTIRYQQEQNQQASA